MYMRVSVCFLRKYIQRIYAVIGEIQVKVSQPKRPKHATSVTTAQKYTDTTWSDIAIPFGCFVQSERYICVQILHTKTINSQNNAKSLLHV